MKFQIVSVPASAGDRPTLPDNSDFPPGLFLLVEKQSQPTSDDVASNTRLRKRQRFDNKGDTTPLPASMTHLQHLINESLPVTTATLSYWALSHPMFVQGSFQQRHCYHRTKFTSKFSETGKEYQVEDKDVVMWTMTNVATGSEDYSIRLLQVSYRDVPNYASLWGGLTAAGCDVNEQKFWTTVETELVKWYQRLRKGQIGTTTKNRKAALYLATLDPTDDKHVLKSWMLHSLIHLDLPMDMLRVALWRYPADVKDSFGKLPIHHLLSQRAKDCAWKYATAEEPAQGFICPREPFSKLRILLEDFVAANPQAAMERSTEGFLPLHLALINGWSYGQGLGAIVNAFPEAMKQRDPNGSLPLHLAVSQGQDCQPISSFVNLLTTYPDAVRLFDTRGDLPLHLALHYKCPCSKIIHRLIEAYPDAVQMRSGSDGELVLHMALKAGWKWHYDREADGLPLHCSWSNARSHDAQLLKRFIDIHEAALCQRSTSRLLPFQLAAESTNVDTTFNLLIRQPNWHI
jgi:hypothetical protein